MRLIVALMFIPSLCWSQPEFRSLPEVQLETGQFFDIQGQGSPEIVGGFEYSNLITLEQFEVYLDAILTDSIESFFHAQKPIPAPDIGTQHFYLSDPQFKDHPVVGVTWTAAMNYIDWLAVNDPQHNYGLPLGSQWAALTLLDRANELEEPHHDLYAEWLRNSFNESVFMFTNSGWPDITYNASTDDPPALKRKRIVGNSYHAFYYDELRMWSRYGYQDSGYADVSFRVIRWDAEGETETGMPLRLDHEGTLDSSLAIDPSNTVVSINLGMFNGPYRSHYTNGQIRAEGQFENNVRVGEWNVYSDQGTLIHSRNYTGELTYDILYPTPPENGPGSLFGTGAVEDLEWNKMAVRPYDPVNERDVVLSQRLWRRLLFSNNEHVSDWNELGRELIQALALDAITAYSSNDDEFREMLEANEGARLLTSAGEIIGFDIKEDWFFDDTRMLSETRIIGIAPLGVTASGDTIRTMWLYYPEIRGVLADIDADAKEKEVDIIHFHNVFIRRYFVAPIWKQSNVYDRELDPAIDPMSIELQLIDQEHDLWLHYNGH